MVQLYFWDIIAAVLIGNVATGMVMYAIKKWGEDSWGAAIIVLPCAALVVWRVLAWGRLGLFG